MMIQSVDVIVTLSLKTYVIQHREHGQYFIITVNGVQPLKIVNYCSVHMQHIIYINYTSIKKF